MRFGRSMVVRCAAVAASSALAICATAPAAGAATLKLKGGTTTLTFGGPAIQALAGMGISFAPTAPATAAGPALMFPISSGTLKVAGRKVVSGKVTHGGGMSLSNPGLVIGLTNPVVNLAGKQSTLKAKAALGSTPPLVIDMATLDLSKATTAVTAKRVRITNAHVKLTELAASTMNAGFHVTGFTPGFEIGTATLSADVKR